MTSSGLLLGIDVGTTSCKASVVDLEGRELAVIHVPTPWDHVPSGAEVDPRRLVEAVVAAAARAVERAGPGTVLGIGVASMAEAAVLLDRRGEPVAPAIAWFDSRGDEEAAELTAELGSSLFTRRTGLPLTRLCTLVKYRWLRGHAPAVLGAVRSLGIAEYVAATLGAEPAAERSLACRTGMLDLWTGDWWDGALDAAGVPASFLATPVQAGWPLGRAGGAIPGTAGATITLAGLDHCAAAIGAGAVRAGDAFTSCGTAEAVIRGAGSARLNPDVVAAAVADGIQVGYHAIGGHALVSGFPAGRALLRALALVGAGAADHADLDAAALSLPRGADGVTLEAPTADAASLRGLTWSAGPAHVWRAALEAVAGESRALLERTAEVAGPHTRLVATGGWWRSAAYAGIRRELLGPVEVPLVEEAGTRGAALLAGRAAGVLPGREPLAALADRRLSPIP